MTQDLGFGLKICGVFHFGETQTLTWPKNPVVPNLVRTGVEVKCIQHLNLSGIKTILLRLQIQHKLISLVSLKLQCFSRINLTLISA